MDKEWLIVLILSLSEVALAQSLTKGIELYDGGKLKEAKVFFVEQPESEKAAYYLGRIAYDEKNFGEAVEYFEAAIDINDQVANYYTWLANSTGSYAMGLNFFRQGILAPKVKTAYEKAVSLDPDNIDSHWGLIEYYTKAPGVLGGSWEKAEATANTIKGLDQLEGHDALATVYERQEEYEKAEQEYIKAAKLDERRAINLGIYYLGREKYSKALIWIDRSIANTKNFNNLSAKTRLLLQTANKTEALKVSDQAAQLANTNQLNNLGYQWMGQKEIDKAIEYFEINVERNPKDPNVHDSLGEAYKAKGMNKEAIKMLKKSMSLNPPPNTKTNSIKLLKELGVEVDEE